MRNSALSARFTFCDGAEICAAAEQAGIEPQVIPALIKKAAALTENWGSMQPAERRSLLHSLVKRIDVRREKVEITVRPGAIAGGVNPALSANGLRLDGSDEDDGPVTVLTIPTRLRRTGKENRLLMEAASSEATAGTDRSLLRVLAQAHLFQDMVMKGDGASIGNLARELGVSASYFTQIVRLSFIAPQ